MQINLKFNHSYLALSVVAALHAPQAFAEAQQDASEEAVATIEQVEPISQDFVNPDEHINSETHATETHEVTEIDSGAIDPVEDISNFYSDIEMRMKLAVKANAQPCSVETCKDNQAFDAKVQLIGESLAKSAYALYPELKKITPKFEFEVVDKKVLGTASNAGGKIVIFRPIQSLDLDDNAIAFIIGREMGHVIAKHHNSNAKTKIFFTVLTGVLFPAATLISASSAAAQATTATTLMTSAASTVTSFVGSEVALSRIKPGQLSEADNISLDLLEYGGVTALDTAQSLEFIVKNETSTGWEKDLNLSIDNVRQLAGDPEEIVVELEPLPDEYVDTSHELTDEELIEADDVKFQENEPKAFVYEESASLSLTQIEPKKNQVEQLPTEIKTVEHQPKTIVITNETLMQNRKKRDLKYITKTNVNQKVNQKAIAKKTNNKKLNEKKAGVKPYKLTSSTAVKSRKLKPE